VLRSKAPDGVTQELYGYLCVHYAVRWLMHTVAFDAGEDPDRLSFTRSIRWLAARRRRTRVFPPQVLDDAHDKAASEILFELLGPVGCARTRESSSARCPSSA